MIDAAVVHGVSVVVYAVAFAVLAALLRRYPDRRSYLAPVVAVVGLTGLVTMTSALEVGIVAIGGGTVDVPRLLVDVFTYGALWAVAARLGGASGRLFWAVVAIPIANLLAFQLLSFVGGVAGLVFLFGVVVGHLATAYLFLGPIWRESAAVPAERRLLHWKARNLLLFLIGMLIAFAVLAVLGGFPAFVTLVIAEYIAVLTRVGFAVFLFANVDAVPTDGLLDGTRFRPSSQTDDGLGVAGD